MMDTRLKEELLEKYGHTLNKWGLIASPGAFEGEPWWSLQVHEWMMDGDGEIISDSDDPAGLHIVFRLDRGERETFGLDEEVVAITLHSSNEGFITCNDHASWELDAYIETVSDENDGGDEDV
jgi:hypothetical protein